MNRLHCFLLVVVLLLVISLFLPPSVLAATQPHKQRSGTNLVSNSTVNGSTGWVLGGGTVYDSAVSRNTGSGSLKLTASYGDTAPNHDYVNSGLMAVTPGKAYTYAYYLRSATWPQAVPTLYVAYYNAQQQYIRNSSGSRQAVSATNDWQECVGILKPQTGEVYVKLKMTLMDRPSGTTGSVWVDEFYFGEGIGFEQAPSAKTAFNGTLVRIDDLGNIEVNKSGTWTSFFPLAIYGDGSRSDWSVYSDQGFNMNMWAGSYVSIQKAKDATSTFNPDGMLSGLQIAQYTSPLGSKYNDITHLEDTIQDIIDEGLMGSLLWYYWDNENSYSEWSVPLAVTNKIKEMDEDANSNRQHPIYVLQGNEGIARSFNNSTVTMTDVVGDYVTGGDTGGALGHIILNSIEEQTQPVVIAQINYGVGNHMRSRLYTAIAKGARGMGFWRDTYNNPTLRPAVEDMDWWDDFPDIRREIDKLMPVIREPHWTTWTLACDDDGMEFGTRDYEGRGHVIAANDTDSSITATFTISGLTSYTPLIVKDYFTGKLIAHIESNEFTVTIPSCGSAVYVLEERLDEMLVLDLQFSESGGTTVDDATVFENDGTTTGGITLNGATLELDGSDDYVDCGNDASLDLNDLDMTIIARVKMDTTQPGSFSGIVTKGAAGAIDAGYMFCYRNTTGDLSVYLSDGTTRIYLDSNDSLGLADGEWHVLAVSLDRDGDADFYVDGVSVGSETVYGSLASSIVNTSRNLLVGSWVNSHKLAGDMDNVRVYRRALTATEVADLSDYVLHLKLDEGADSTAYDSSVYGNDGSLVGSPAWGTDLLEFDGTNDKIDCGDDDSLEMDTDDFGVAVLVRINTTQSGYAGLITKGAGNGTDSGYTFTYYATTGRISFWMSDGTTRIHPNSNTSLGLNDGEWHWIAANVDRDGSVTFYVDGESVGSASCSSMENANITSTRNLQVGSWITSHYLDGETDEVIVKRGLFTAAELAKMVPPDSGS
jgi:Concanavalin A-like lectin/glucanases superfamily